MSYLDHVGQYGFPREFGIPERFVINDIDEYCGAICEFDGRKHCYVSVYQFWNVKNYNTAIIDMIFLDFDKKNENDSLKDVLEEVRRLCKFLSSNKVTPRVYFSGRKGFHVFIDFREVDLKHPRKTIRKFVDKIAKRLNLQYLDMSVVGDLARISRIPDTIHMKSGLYCIPLTNNEIFDLEVEDILKKARSPRPTFRIQKTISRDVKRYLELIDKQVEQEKRNKRLRQPLAPKNIKFNKNSKLRPCVQVMIHNAKNGNFAMDHQERLAILFELLNNDWNNDAIISIFSKQTDFDVNITEKQIEQARSKNYKPFKCKTLKYELKCCLSNCKRSKKV